MTRRGMLLVTNGRSQALIVPSALSVWERSGWALVNEDAVAPEPQEPAAKARAKRARAPKPHTPKTPPAPAEEPARDDSAETLDSDEPETAPAEESA